MVEKSFIINIPLKEGTLMQLQVHTPTHSILQQYIECIYVLNRDPDDKPICYLTFPNVFPMVSISMGTRTEVNGIDLTISGIPGNRLESNLVHNFRNAALIQYSGAVNEITIYFKPLGINAFLEKDLVHYSRLPFTAFCPYQDYTDSMTHILSMERPEDRFEAIESYWLSKLIGFRHPFLYNVVNDILQNAPATSVIQDLASKYHLSRVTFHKQFARHLRTTPANFKKVLRFRNAMKEQLKAENRLTDISYAADYFDQSHMAKDFKSLTRLAPKDFFARVSRMENGRINWLFL